ncbi:mitochondrial ribosomal protein L37-domain-containing protein [Xylariaceae sp. FL0804]|nr:mitochondrial ribosomal protein L37-domain-containing protein [Xylariaceae sp. FL0804]
MICRRCLQRASASLTPPCASPRTITTTTTITTSSSFSRPFSISLPIRSTSSGSSSSTISALARQSAHHRPLLVLPLARPYSSSPAPTPPPEGAASSGPQEGGPTPPTGMFGTPLAEADARAAAAGAEPLSACLEGTVLTGLNYFKGRADPVALRDDEYPAWLWRCLDVKEGDDDADAVDGADEFSKSRKQRRLAKKKQRALEERLLASGDIEALAPKIPLQHQSVNLPANAEGTAAGAARAQQAREDLRRAMRRERKGKMKESNYLKSM